MVREGKEGRGRRGEGNNRGEGERTCQSGHLGFFFADIQNCGCMQNHLKRKTHKRKNKGTLIKDEEKERRKKKKKKRKRGEEREEEGRRNLSKLLDLRGESSGHQKGLTNFRDVVHNLKKKGEER